ncbi:2Fe-2S iron-sulfur cluster-binding protein [Rhodococcus sp. T7]|uniref:2Fe-2S iron-sulfur cluster-binding protein n=1 Tax=Rhodococcus sp. T7 TaxID=627444 RepID=UPI00135CC6EE|nr:2Fe-2S iron-sulfur cluster-binding protein [Rhodococcus sp. T7]KAF0957983.1 Rhodocoxin [Rhodococcus sp. T7]KAF0960142.1 Rhodocoxin [Rhodococcus sp. T7]
MPIIKFQSVDGDVHIAEAGDGESLMRVAVRNEIPGIVGECGGEMSCATCHIYISAPWADQVTPASADEHDLLEISENYRPESRLACQIHASGFLDGLVAEVVAE